MEMVWTQIEPPPEEAQQTALKKGWKIKHAPFKSVHFLTTDLPDNPDLLLVSSKYAARFVANHGGLKGLPFACVGNQSKTILESAGLIALFQPSQSASELAGHLPNIPRETKVLFVTGTHRRPTLEKTLDHLGFSFQVAEVYKTRVTDPLPEITNPEIAIFFAPSAVEDYDRHYKPPQLSIAIGPTTAESMDKAGWKHHTSPEPTWRAIFETLEKHDAEIKNLT